MAMTRDYASDFLKRKVRGRSMGDNSKLSARFVIGIIFASCVIASERFLRGGKV
jgi:hypothetical protein